MPLIYLGIRASEADLPELLDLLFRPRNAELLLNTFLLAAVVLGSGTLIALPLAWITERSDFPLRAFAVVFGFLPLTIPGYVMAYALLSIGGDYGIAARLIGVAVPRLSGLWGAGIALTLYTFPYLYLNLRTALAGMDRRLEEAAESFGYTGMGIFFRVILPQLRPAYFSGALAVILYVIGDFGVVALMRFPVFSYAVYTQYSAAFDRVYAAVLSLLLTAFSVILFALEARMRRRSISSPVGAAAKGRARVYALGAWRLPALLFVCALATISAALPAGTLLYWMTQIRRPEAVVEVLASFARSFAASVPAALIATAIAVPTVYLADRRPSGMSSALERTATLGYGIPPIALALGMVFFSLRGAPVLYQSLGVLIAAYSLNFLALALGPIRSALAQTPAQVEEAARSLGNTGFQAFALALVPALTKGMTSSAILVFIMSMKELPLTLLLSPTGYTTLASAVFSRTGEALYAEAAPFAAAIILFSSLCVGLVIRYEGTRHAPA